MFANIFYYAFIVTTFSSLSHHPFSRNRLRMFSCKAGENEARIVTIAKSTPSLPSECQKSFIKRIPLISSPPWSLTSSLPNLPHPSFTTLGAASTCVRGEGRDMGEIRNISPVLPPPCAKAFRKMTGEMSDFYVFLQTVIMKLGLAIRHAYAPIMAGYFSIRQGSLRILATYYSHAGNISFPRWECFVPSVGINTANAPCGLLHCF